ncbi:Emopamil-binding protein [Backusella circina FSU 941]|nr:Emopamil-binding protein [Backusella circina FSU 941]
MEHPYYPKTLSIPNFVPSQRSTPEILLLWNGVISAVVLLSVFLSRFSGNKNISVAKLAWFTACGALHFGFEGYWIVYNDTISSRTDLIADVWKEFAYSDSKFLVPDDLLYTLEFLSATVWGSLCALSAYSIWKGSPQQYLFQLITSICHLYSCTLYYLLDYTDSTHRHPHPFYFWVYFVSFNLPFLIVPSLLIAQSCRHIKNELVKAKLE